MVYSFVKRVAVRLRDIYLYVRYADDIERSHAMIAGGVLIGASAIAGFPLLERALAGDSGVRIEGGLPFVAYESPYTPITSGDGEYVASKNGSTFYSKKCKGWVRIDEKNRIYFASSADAMSSGYKLARGCHIQ